ncbi:viral aspartic protease [Cereibacter azotoformans]|uniref:viral aspartic protease n=1 Tax=Cereibacter azotoformans TaxID=43057 RepID=UPI000C6D52E0|nr:viral aspartic protease [Cereibacter azotoformans]
MISARMADARPAARRGVRAALWAAVCCSLAACGGGGGSGGGQPEPNFPGREVVTEGIENYVTDHNGYSRVRIDNATRQADRDALGQFDDADPASPAGYRSLIEEAENGFPDSVFVEVIARMDGSGKDGGKVVKVLRLTADQAPFDNVDKAGNPVGSGKYYFRGTGSFRVYASVDGGGVLTGKGDLENLTIDFDKGTAAINLRTGVNDTSQIETQILADDLAFNVVTGTFGGAITQTARVGGETLTARGHLRGSISGTEDSLKRLNERMTTSGVFSADGERLKSDGIFWGSQLNYR